MKSALCAIAIALASMTAQAKDYVIHVGKNHDIILTDKPCQANDLIGSDWKRGLEQYIGRHRPSLPTNIGCWKRIADKVYVLPDIEELPDGTFLSLPKIDAQGLYVRLTMAPCKFSVPGVSFAPPWFGGRGVYVEIDPKSGVVRLAPGFKAESICWRNSPTLGLEVVGEPAVYSAFQVRDSVLP